MNNGINIFLDWDDTLFPSYYISKEKKSEITINHSELQQLDLIIRDLLTKLLTIGTITIITNSKDGWVHKSALQYLPQSSGIIFSIPVISAQAIYSGQTTYIEYWKVFAMRHCLVGKLGNPITQIISIGDNEYERMAANIVSDELKKTIQLNKTHGIQDDREIYLKIFKLLNFPTINQLAIQLGVLKDKIQEYIDQKNDIFFEWEGTAMALNTVSEPYSTELIESIKEELVSNKVNTINPLENDAIHLPDKDI
jgi:hypothetical protein